MRSVIRMLLLVLLVRGAVPLPADAQPTAFEDRLKAAFVSKFPQFVEWPPPALAGRRTIDVCAAASASFGTNLDQLVAGESVNGRSLVARRVERESDLDGCQVLFLSSALREREAPLLNRARTLPILTVSDAPSFLDDGGIVRLRVVEGRVRFDVDTVAAQRVGLRISSQLLRLAVTVRGATS